MCIIPITFIDFKKGIENNLFDLYFLDSFCSKLCFQLNQLFHEKKDADCSFLHSEFRHHWRNWVSLLSQTATILVK